MNSDFLHFWAEFLRQAADGQLRVEAMERWIQSGFSPNGALAELFRASYGLPQAKTMGAEQWQKATDEFLAVLKTYAPLWGWVPLARHDRLKRKAERLERKIADQTRTIQQLEALLDEKGLGHSALMTRFQNLISDQTQAFDQLMQTMTDISDGSKQHHS